MPLYDRNVFCECLAACAVRHPTIFIKIASSDSTPPTSPASGLHLKQRNAASIESMATKHLTGQEAAELQNKNTKCGASRMRSKLSRENLPVKLQCLFSQMGNCPQQLAGQPSPQRMGARPAETDQQSKQQFLLTCMTCRNRDSPQYLAVEIAQPQSEATRCDG